MADRMSLITGGTQGIGRALAVQLLHAGWQVAFLARDPQRGQSVISGLDEPLRARASLVSGDLSSLASIRQAAADVRDRYPRLDLLVNSAGVYKSAFTETAEGFETMFATNHLGPFLLSLLLVPSLAAAPESRVLTISAPSTVKVDFDDLQRRRSFNSIMAFGATKMMGLLFTFEAARRWQEQGIMVNAIHPGVVKTGLMSEANLFMRLVTRLAGRTPEQAAAGILPVADSPEYAGQTGRFYRNGVEIAPPAAALDREAQQRLWEMSEQLAGL